MSRHPLRRSIRWSLMAAAALWAAMPVRAQVVDQNRPRIGLVLSGGGARGLAHVGVLKVLDELHVPVDAVVGTSMGALVGGLYASGMSTADIEKLVKSLDWQDAFKDSPPRTALGFRRKQDDRNFLVRYSLGVGRDGFKLPTGLIQGQKETQLLRSATLSVADITRFDALPTPFRALATDLETGQEIVLSDGDLVTAMRASMSAPGVFTPVEREGRLLIDGGLVNNLPVDVARQMNVDVLIVVDVSFPLYSRNELNSPLTVTNQAAAIMVRNRTAEKRASLRADDIVIDPALGTMSSADFSRVQQALDAGADAARRLMPQLRTLALNEDEYRTWLASRQPNTPAAPHIDFIQTDAGSTRYAAAVQGVVGDLRGQSLDRTRINADLSSLYALDLFESIDYTLVSRNNQTGLDFHLRPKSWGPDYIRVGLNLEDDFAGNSRYNLAARYIRTDLNSLGAEWLTDLQIGDQPRIATEYYQPLSWQPRYFIAPRVDYSGRIVPLLQDDHQIARYRVRTLQGELAVGRELSNWGELRVGLQRGSGSSRLLVGDPALPVERYDTGGYFARLSYDTFDSVYFPKQGQQFVLQWNSERRWMGAGNDASKLSMSMQWAFPVGRYTWIAATDLGSSLSGSPATHDFFTLGGFLNLSGLTTDSIAGPHYGIARMVIYRQIGRGGSGVLELPAYAGISLEAGNVWNSRKDASFESLRHDGSLFFGADTPLGPVYLAAGVDDRRKTAFYLFLGRSF